MEDQQKSRFKYEGIGIRTDCVSYRKAEGNKPQECSSLTCLLCEADKCSFYKARKK